MHWAKRGDSPITSQTKVSDNNPKLERKVQGPPGPFFRPQQKESLHQMRNLRLVVSVEMTISCAVIGHERSIPDSAAPP